MSARFEISSSTGIYPVHIESGLFESALRGEEVLVVCDGMFEERVAGSGAPYISVLADETSKSLDATGDVIIKMKELGATRSTHILAVGGGVIQDVAAFASSIYMRGLEWTYVPTTLLAMADSCIGGKSSINVGKFKNIVGTFRPPQSVLIDPTFVPGLPAQQRVEGLCEAAKICFARGAAPYDSYAALEPDVDMPLERLEQVIALSLEAKKWFVETDEFDRDERLLLNFGHTFGHALEGASNFAVSHGIAVGLGMLCALELGGQLGVDYSNSARTQALRTHVEALLARADGLSESICGVSGQAALGYFKCDKKHGRDNYAVILVGEDGALERRFLLKSEQTDAEIERAFAAALMRRSV